MIPKIICRRPGVHISTILQLGVMSGIVSLLYLSPYGSIQDKTYQTFLTQYNFICILLCYIQFNTSISPKNSRDLESLMVLVLFQVFSLIIPVQSGLLIIEGFLF